MKDIHQYMTSLSRQRSLDRLIEDDYDFNHVDALEWLDKRVELTHLMKMQDDLCLSLAMVTSKRDELLRSLTMGQVTNTENKYDPLRKEYIINVVPE